MTVNRKFHERCSCKKEVSFCKTKCDQDRNCKGYVELYKGQSKRKCNIATSSECTDGCSKLNKAPRFGDLGALDKDGIFKRIYDGCFIKSSGMSIGSRNKSLNILS